MVSYSHHLCTEKVANTDYEAHLYLVFVNFKE